VFSGVDGVFAAFAVPHNLVACRPDTNLDGRPERPRSRGTGTVGCRVGLAVDRECAPPQAHSFVTPSLARLVLVRCGSSGLIAA